MGPRKEFWCFSGSSKLSVPQRSDFSTQGPVLDGSTNKVAEQELRENLQELTFVTKYCIAECLIRLLLFPALWLTRHKGTLKRGWNWSCKCWNDEAAGESASKSRDERWGRGHLRQITQKDGESFSFYSIPVQLLC